MEKYAKNVKTVEDVQQVPATQFILLLDYENYTCPFCGKKLTYEIVGFGRDKCRQYHHCDCEVARAAEAHNKRQKELEDEAWAKKHEERAKAEAKRREEEAKKPVTITAAQMFCVITGRIIPGVEPVPADDAVGAAMHHAGFTEGSSKKNLEAYAEAQGFVERLKNAGEKIVSYIKETKADWDTDISGKVKELCSEYSIPESLTL